MKAGDSATNGSTSARLGPARFSFHHGGVSVPNLDESIEWYRSVLGFELETRVHLAHIPADIAFIRNGDMRMELFELAGATPLPESRRIPDEDLMTHGNKHVAFVVDDARQFAAELAQRGADVVWVRDMPDGTAAFVRDNSGNLIEFLNGPAPKGVAGAL